MPTESLLLGSHGRVSLTHHHGNNLPFCYHLTSSTELVNDFSSFFSSLCMGL